MNQNQRSRVTCFVCQKTGHRLVDCPQASEQQKNGQACYNCNSREHKASGCPEAKQIAFHRVIKEVFCYLRSHLFSSCQHAKIDPNYKILLCYWFCVLTWQEKVTWLLSKTLLWPVCIYLCNILSLNNVW